MRIAIVTDAWRPQTNGVVTTLGQTASCAEQLGHDVRLLTPAAFATVACPSYPEVRLAVNARRETTRWLGACQPHAIHIATEGPLGLAARAACVRRSLPFTTSYHTQFPEYVHARWRIPLAAGHAYMRWFHRPASRTLVGTPAVREALAQRGMDGLVLWSRGVDTRLFRPRERGESPFAASLPRPLMLYAGRVAIEKNLEAFLDLRLPGTKIVVGGGPQLEALQARYPQVLFTGFRFGEELARSVAAADVFVFPSRTDTFGLVMLEAMASGVPVAAFPVAGPLDVVRHGISGVLDEDLAAAIGGALALERRGCRAYAETHTWERSTRQFIGHLVPAVAQLAASRRRTSTTRLPCGARPSRPDYPY